MGTDASWLSMETDQRCCAVCGESRMHGAKRGGWGNVAQGNAPCPYPTGMWEILRRLTPLSGLQEDILQRLGLGASLYGQLEIQAIGT